MENINLSFRYFKKNGRLIHTFPFRTGDVVIVKDWGERYSTYHEAFEKFGMKHRGCKRPSPQEHKVFKIKGMLKHHVGNRIICHIIGRDFSEYVIDAQGLTPLRVYPLREKKGETCDIVLETV